MKSTGKISKGNPKQTPNQRRDRKSGSGMDGSPKKGGHGGKFTWSGDGYSPMELGFVGVGEVDKKVDFKDPNYDDPVVRKKKNIDGIN